MRMWMVDPKRMCRKHLLGEHVEIHMFIGTIKKHKSLQGYINNNLVELTSLESRHEELVNEMKRRGMNHKSEIDSEEIKEALKFYNEKTINFKVDRESSLNELLRRCKECH